MRRILSILLLLALGLCPCIPAGALAPGLRSGWTGKVDESRIPACCRRNGKHHCAMPQDLAPDGLTTIGSDSTCPWMPNPLASTAPSLSAHIQAAKAPAIFPSEPHIAPAVASAAQMSDRQTQPKRGPPAAQSL